MTLPRCAASCEASYQYHSWKCCLGSNVVSCFAGVLSSTIESSE